MTFQSTPSAWRETISTTPHVHRPMHFNPLPPHGGRLLSAGNFSLNFLFQSTPSAWRETVGNGMALHTLDISIHSLRMEGDNLSHSDTVTSKNFNPLPPHGGRRNTTLPDGEYTVFQSTPSAWRETVEKMPTLYDLTFQSTPSAWRETKTLGYVEGIQDISIHSLRMEGDFPQM